MSKTYFVERVTKETFIVYAHNPTDAVLQSFDAEIVQLHLYSIVYDEYGTRVGDTESGLFKQKEIDLFEFRTNS